MSKRTNNEMIEWPMIGHHSIHSLVSFDGISLKLSSLDSRAALALPAHQQFFLVQLNIGNSEEENCRQQIFPVRAAPPNLQRPLEIARALLALLSRGESLGPSASPLASSLSFFSPAPAPRLLSLEETFDDSSEPSQKSLFSLHTNDSALPDFCSLAIQADQQGILWRLSDHSVIGKIAADESALLLANSRFHHFVERGEFPATAWLDEKIYAIEGIPVKFNAAGTQSERNIDYPIKQFAQKALTMAEHAKSLDSPQPACPPAFSPDPVFRQVLLGVGEFSSFSDGRVLVRFVDRTLVDLEAGGKSAKILDNRGQRHRIDKNSQQQRFDDYINAAMEFARFSSLSPAERRSAFTERLEVSQWLAEQRRATE